MKILSWNICCLPNVINLYQNPKFVIDNIIQTLHYYDADIICLQELFDQYCINEIKRTFTKYTILYDTKGPKAAINSGLMILSKHPLIDYGFHEFKSKCGEDRMSCKGFIYGVYKINEKHVTIYNTHLNNDKPIINFFSNSSSVIQRELEQLFIHIYKTNKVCSTIFACGDFNSEPYKIKAFLNTFYATHRLRIEGFASESTLITENKAIDHILYISNSKNINNITLEQKVYRFNVFSDHCLVEKTITGI
jgi:endonuclease/exonuclease/phosphatase family metal-dependent hydrolase